MQLAEHTGRVAGHTAACGKAPHARQRMRCLHHQACSCLSLPAQAMATCHVTAKLPECMMNDAACSLQAHTVAECQLRLKPHACMN